jgi:hypothetical protein
MRIKHRGHVMRTPMLLAVLGALCTACADEPADTSVQRTAVVRTTVDEGSTRPIADEPADTSVQPKAIVRTAANEGITWPTVEPDRSGGVSTTLHGLRRRYAPGSACMTRVKFRNNCGSPVGIPHTAELIEERYQVWLRFVSCSHKQVRAGEWYWAVPWHAITDEGVASGDRLLAVGVEVVDFVSLESVRLLRRKGRGYEKVWTGRPTCVGGDFDVRVDLQSKAGELISSSGSVRVKLDAAEAAELRAFRWLDERRMMRFVGIPGLGSWGGGDPVEDMMREFLERFPNSRLVNEVRFTLGLAFRRKADYEHASEAMSTVARSTKDDRLREYASVLLALMLVQSDRMGEAQVVLDRLGSISELAKSRLGSVVSFVRRKIRGEGR